MPRRTKTVEELNEDLVNLRARYDSEGLSINSLINSSKQYESARKYLSRNRDKPDDDPRILEKKRILMDNQDEYKKYLCM